ncbi:hypothetical protein K488DRAFT_89372 [Vararia minispora EC-137]|uniref:Uncharacterized protein n=1 Tax=Vararia minispora EC-137 TaxID=1314806 RepID=A0ACB8QAI3_9AGAM|nr:hypothetical protein K488DRAFT_89372 [Vararia minispora EC-137]
MSMAAMTAITHGHLFQALQAGKPFFTCTLIENRPEMEYRWPLLRDQYFPYLLAHMRKMNPDAQIKLTFKYTSPNPVRINPADMQYNMIPNIPLFDPVFSNRLSVGDLFFCAKLLATNAEPNENRHLFVLAISTPTDAVEITPAMRAQCPGILHAMDELRVLEPCARWARLRDTLQKVSARESTLPGLQGFRPYLKSPAAADMHEQANIRLHMILNPQTEPGPLLSLFYDVLHAQKCAEVRPWFPVDHMAYTLYLAGEAVAPDRDVPGPPPVIRSGTDPGPTRHALSHAAAPPPPDYAPPSSPPPPFPLPRGPAAPHSIVPVPRPRLNSLPLPPPSSRLSRSSTPTTPSPPATPKSSSIVAHLQTSHGLTKRRNPGTREPVVDPSLIMQRHPSPPSPMAAPLGRPRRGTTSSASPTVVNGGIGKKPKPPPAPQRFALDGLPAVPPDAGEKPFIFYPEVERSLNVTLAANGMAGQNSLAMTGQNSLAMAGQDGLAITGQNGMAPAQSGIGLQGGMLMSMQANGLAMAAVQSAHPHARQQDGFMAGAPALMPSHVPSALHPMPRQEYPPPPHAQAPLPPSQSSAAMPLAPGHNAMQTVPSPVAMQHHPPAPAGGMQSPVIPVALHPVSIQPTSAAMQSPQTQGSLHSPVGPSALQTARTTPPGHGTMSPMSPTMHSPSVMQPSHTMHSPTDMHSPPADMQSPGGIQPQSVFEPPAYEPPQALDSLPPQHAVPSAYPYSPTAYYATGDPYWYGAPEQPPYAPYAPYAATPYYAAHRAYAPPAAQGVADGYGAAY